MAFPIPMSAMPTVAEVVQLLPVATEIRAQITIQAAKKKVEEVSSEHVHWPDAESKRVPLLMLISSAGKLSSHTNGAAVLCTLYFALT